MSAIRVYLIFLLLGQTLIALGQNTSRLQGEVLDKDTGSPIAGVHVSVSGTDRGTVTDKDGGFTLDAVRYPITLEFTHVGYVAHLQQVEQPREGEGVEVALLRAINELPGVTIRRTLPEVVYQRPDLHVGDHFVNDDGLWVLTYERPQFWHRESEAGREVFREARLHLLDTLFNEICSVRLPGEVVGLRRDHAMRIIVEGMFRAYYAELNDTILSLSVMDLGVLQEHVLPWTDSVPGYLLGSNFTTTYPAFDHIAFDPIHDLTKRICVVEDPRSLELFRSQYKYMSGRDKVIAMDLELDTGIDREVIAGFMTGFHEDLYYSSPYAPLYVSNDTIRVFDHCQGRIRTFSSDLRPLGEAPMKHQLDRAWDSRLIQDRATGKVYVVYARHRATWIRSIDPNTGQLSEAQYVTHPYPEQLQVHAGHMYYVFRPFGSLQHRTLYREALR